jgi:MraZ protein
VTNDLFHGYALNAVDAKNRLSVPASYRDIIEQRGGGRALIVSPHERAPCLIAYDKGRSARLQSQLESRFDNQYDDARDSFARLSFGASEQIPYDDNGRIIVSAMMRDFGEIDRFAFFLATGDFFEIWNPQTLIDHPATDPRVARLVARQLEAKGAA